MTSHIQERYINRKTIFDAYSENEQDVREYEESIKVYRDLNNVINTAERKGREEGLELGREQGREEGLEQGREEGLELGREQEKAATVRRLHDMGLTIEQIAQGTALPENVIRQILQG